MGTPILKLIFDRPKRSSRTKEGGIELRITYNRMQKHVTTGVRVLPQQWKDGRIVKRLDAYELQHTLDMFVANARKVVNELMERGELDMKTVVAVIGGKQKKAAAENTPCSMLLMDYFRDRATIRKYGRSEDSKERYDRFLRWFETWGGMLRFVDITELKVLEMDAALAATGMKDYSKWQNYHRFLNSFIIDAIDDGYMRRNPYKHVHINKDKSTGGIGKYLTPKEFRKIESMELPTESLRRVRDVFVFQTYTCLSYTDLAAFDPMQIRTVSGKKVYEGKRGKTSQGFTFLIMNPALRILQKYDYHLPVISNVKYNQYLKAIAQHAGIDKPLSSHWARHTGATLLLNEGGVPMEIVAKVLGHSSTKITRKVYAKLLDETVVDAMSMYEESMCGDASVSKRQKGKGF